MATIRDAIDTAIGSVGASWRLLVHNPAASLSAADARVRVDGFAKSDGASGLVTWSGHTLTVPATGTAALLNTALTAWSPTYTFTGGGSVSSYAKQQGYYTVVGGVAHVWGYIGTAGLSTSPAPSGDVRISLPIAVANQSNLYAPMTVGWSNNWATAMTLRGYAAPNETVVRLRKNATDAADISVVAADVATGSGKNYLIFSLTYPV